MIPLMDDVVITDELKRSPEPWGSIAACSNGRNATVVKYTDVTSVEYVSFHSWTDSPFHSLSLSSPASDLSGSALGPGTPALATIVMR